MGGEALGEAKDKFVNHLKEAADAKAEADRLAAAAKAEADRLAAAAKAEADRLAKLAKEKLEAEEKLLEKLNADAADVCKNAAECDMEAGNAGTWYPIGRYKWPDRLDKAQFWHTAPCRKKNKNDGGCYGFHHENMLKGWENGNYKSAWLAGDCKCYPGHPDCEKDCMKYAWFIMDLKKVKWIKSVKLIPRCLEPQYDTSAYEILVSQARGSGEFGSDFEDASAGYTQRVNHIEGKWIKGEGPTAYTVGKTHDERTHEVKMQGRYIMFHALSYNEGGWGNRAELGPGVASFKVIAADLPEDKEIEEEIESD